MISCQVLGPVVLSVDGGPAPPELLWRKHLALLIYLARSPRGRTREHLVGLLWPDKPETAARHSLNEAIRVLRRYVGDTGVDTSGGQVRLAPGSVRLDVDRLEELADAAEWEPAARLVAGDFLEGFAVPAASGFEDWLAAERARVLQRSVEVLVRYAGILLVGGQYAEATNASLRALGLDPASEEAVRLTMRSLALAGDRSSALSQYQAFCTRLKQDLGTSPTADTQALADRVRQERSIRPAPAAKARESAEAEMRAPLVGREVELARLLDTAASAVSQRRACALIVQGEPGVGKTRLLEELLTHLRLQGTNVAEVRAVEADLEEEWSGVLALARGGLVRAPGLAAASSGALAVFAAAIPEWGDRFPASRQDGAAVSIGRALSEVARAVTEEQPLAMAIDDAQWLDQPSMLALIATLRDMASAPFLLILAADPQPPRVELDELRTRLGREILGTVIKLSPLNSADLRSLARRMLPWYTDLEIERLVRRVATDSAGLPLLAVELFRAVSLGLDLRSTPGAWPEPLRTLDQTLPGELPDTVSAAIRVGYRRLSPAAQSVLSAASVLGGRVSPEQLARTLQRPPAHITDALDELEWHQWLVCDARGYTFVARVVQQIIAREMLTPGQRQRILAVASLQPTVS